MVSSDTGIGWVKFWTVLNYIAGIIGCPVVFILWAKVYGLSDGAVGLMALLGLAFGVLVAFSWDCLVCTPAIKIYQMSDQVEYKSADLSRFAKSIAELKESLERMDSTLQSMQQTQRTAVSVTEQTAANSTSSAVVSAPSSDLAGVSKGQESKRDFEPIVSANEVPDELKALIVAANSDAPDALRALVAAGENVNVRAKNGMTALMFAVASNANVRVVKMLLEAGSDVYARDRQERTALIYAALSNTNPDVTKALVDAGADVNTKTSWDQTVLMCAAERNTNPNVIQVLLDAGANKDAKDSNGKMALDYLDSRKDNFYGTTDYWSMRALLY